LNFDPGKQRLCRVEGAKVVPKVLVVTVCGYGDITTTVSVLGIKIVFLSQGIVRVDFVAVVISGIVRDGLTGRRVKGVHI
jgi:hypothetical protein